MNLNISKIVSTLNLANNFAKFICIEGYSFNFFSVSSI